MHLGNYWDDYKEKYPNARRIWSKGIWNNPYEISGGNNKDKYPFINPIRNISPDKPSLDGPSLGNPRKEYFYLVSSIDLNWDNIFYYIDWGDGSIEEWIGPYNSGEEIQISHTWKKQGEYIIKVKAKDFHGAESIWSDPLSVSMPRNRAVNSLFLQFLEGLLEKFPNAFPILRLLLQGLGL